MVAGGRSEATAEAQHAGILAAIHASTTSTLIVAGGNSVLYKNLKDSLDNDARIELLHVERLNKSNEAGFKAKVRRKRAAASSERSATNPTEMEPGEGSNGGGSEVEDQSASGESAKAGGEGVSAEGAIDHPSSQPPILTLDANVFPGSTGGFVVEHLPAAGAFAGVDDALKPFRVVILHAVQVELSAARPSRRAGEKAPCRARLLALSGSPPPLVTFLPPPSVPTPGRGDTRILNELREYIHQSLTTVVFASNDKIMHLRSLALSSIEPLLRPLLVNGSGHASGIPLDLTDLNLRRRQWAGAIWSAGRQGLAVSAS